jgi:hypothetical protein
MQSFTFDLSDNESGKIEQGGHSQPSPHFPPFLFIYQIESDKIGEQTRHKYLRKHGRMISKNKAHQIDKSVIMYRPSGQQHHHEGDERESSKTQRIPTKNY